LRIGFPSKLPINSLQMKILVPIKRVPDYDTRIRVKPDGSGIVTEGVKFSMNPFDAIAVEEAIRIKERLPGAEITALSIGTEESVETLRVALAMGADRAIRVAIDADMDSLAIAKVLAAVYHREKPHMVLMGKQAIDDDSNQAGQMLAGLLGVPQATFVSKIEMGQDGATALCSRETDAGIEKVQVRMPAVITTDLRLNEPRYVSLPGIMKAKKKPVEELTPSALSVDCVSRTRVLSMEAPARRKAGLRVKSLDELIDRLKTEAKVL